MRLGTDKWVVGLLCVGLVFFVTDAPGAEEAAVRPHILWLDAEDANVNWFGCYGNPAATTPNIDRLAEEGFRYTHAFANAPVCAPSRSTWITGVMALSMGTHPMRSRYAIPHDSIPYYPDLLRAAGYFCSAHGKTDYNIGGRPDGQCWDARGQHVWQERAEGQPFFSAVHFPDSHESRAFGNVDNPRHDPARQRLRAYHPDVPGIRNNYAHYADAVQRMDQLVGQTLQQLEEDGLADRTIVIFTTDHGGVMPASKRFLTDSGTHCPLIIRIPEKFRHLWPAEQPGMTVDRLVSFVDMPKTWLSLAGAEVPEHMQGRIFLGPDQEPERTTHFAFRGRMDERYDSVRAVRDKRFLYLKNYMPYVPAGQRLNYLWQMVATQAWQAHHRAGLTDAITGRFFRPRPQVEELYDTHRDPDNIVNLVDCPAHAEILERMRAELRGWQLEVYDAGMIPERMMARRAAAKGTTIYEMVRDPERYDLEAYLDAADLALEADPANMEKLLELLEQQDPGLRYWGTAGLRMQDSLCSDAVAALQTLLADSSHEVRALAAWTLLAGGHVQEAAQNCLIELLEDGSYASLLVLNVIDHVAEDVQVYLPAVQNAQGGNYVDRMKEYLLGDTR